MVHVDVPPVSLPPPIGETAGWLDRAFSLDHLVIATLAYTLGRLVQANRTRKRDRDRRYLEQPLTRWIDATALTPSEDLERCNREV